MLWKVCHSLSRGDQVYDIIHYDNMNNSATFSMEYEFFNDKLKPKSYKMPNASFFSLFELHWNALDPSLCNIGNAGFIMFSSI